jgi:chromosome segregation ATPase
VGLNELEKKLHEAKAVFERANKKLHELTIKHDKLTATILQLDTFLHRCLNAEHKIKEIINKIKKNQIEFDKTLKKIAFIKKEIVELQEDRKHAIKKHLFDVVKVIDEKILHLSLNLSKEETNLINIQNTLNEDFKTLAVDELKLKQILKKFAKIYKDKDYNEKYYEHKVYEPEYKHHEPEYKHYDPEYKHYFPFPDHHEPEYKHYKPEYKHYTPDSNTKCLIGDVMLAAGALVFVCIILVCPICTFPNVGNTVINIKQQWEKCKLDRPG